MLSKHISQSDRLERAILLIRILGYATFLGLITIIFIAAWAQYATLTTLQRVTREDGIFENFFFLDVSRDFENFILVWAIFYGLMTVGNVGSTRIEYYPNAGPKFALVPLVLTAVLACLLSLVYSFSLSDIDTRFNLINFAIFFLFIVIFICTDISIRSKWADALMSRTKS